MCDDYKFLRYEPVDEGTIVRIILDRPGSRNAQNQDYSSNSRAQPRPLG
jgi:enoyl-CoA hydratase